MPEINRKFHKACTSGHSQAASAKVRKQLRAVRLPVRTWKRDLGAEPRPAEEHATHILWYSRNKDWQKYFEETCSSNEISRGWRRSRMKLASARRARGEKRRERPEGDEMRETSSVNAGRDTTSETESFTTTKFDITNIK